MTWLCSTTNIIRNNSSLSIIFNRLSLGKSDYFGSDGCFGGWAPLRDDTTAAHSILQTFCFERFGVLSNRHPGHNEATLEIHESHSQKPGDGQESEIEEIDGRG